MNGLVPTRRDLDQMTAVEKLRESLRSGKRRPICQAPTGFGKTKLAARVVESALKKGKRIVFTVPAISLVDQTVEMFWKEGVQDVGVIQAQHEMTNWSRPVQVCSVQSLMRRTVPKGDIVVIDECHRWFEFYGKWMMSEEWRAIPFIGLSATPWTKGLGRFYDDLIIAETTKGAIKKGYLTPFQVFAPSHPDLTGVRTQAGDYHEGDLSQAMNVGDLVGDAVQTWMKLAKGAPTFVFAVDRAHARSLQKQFQDHGVSNDYIDAFTSRNEREAVKRRFHDGLTKVVCNVGCLTTGVDWDVRCISLCRPTKSEILFVQMMGRGLRTAEGKDYCTILDHSDTHLRLGFVDSIHHDKLDDGSEKRSSKTVRMSLPKECPQCHFLKPPRTAKCSNCGFVAEAHSKIEHEQGELGMFTGKHEYSREAKQQFFGMLAHHAFATGKRWGWVAHTFKEKFGVWPRGLDDTPIEPTPQMQSWLRSRNIRWAKSKRNPNNEVKQTPKPKPPVVAKKKSPRHVEINGLAVCPSPEEIAGARTRAGRGGWTQQQLEEWGVPWPPQGGWKKALEERYRILHSDGLR